MWLLSVMYRPALFRLLHVRRVIVVECRESAECNIVFSSQQPLVLRLRPQLDHGLKQTVLLHQVFLFISTSAPELISC